ncbi:MAG: WD40/YVTN/BNR-like repeat-containing protein [Oscillospiraceae bacterium]
MTKKITKFAAAALAAAMCLSLFAGCKKNDGTDEESGSVSESAAENAGAASNAAANSDWSYGQVAISGGGFVTGVFSTPEENVYYCKTDVGGAYYRTAETGKWTSMNYWVSADDKGLLGIDGLAFDPQSPNKVYLLAGTEYFSNGKTCILISEDYGKTVEVVDVTDKIKVHGNGMGRGNGERIAVDPNNGSIIFAGGRTGGMIKSTDGGKTWESVSSFPITSTSNNNGINCILFDPSSAKDGVTQKIYASVSAKGDETGNLFVSEDAGSTWKKLDNSITDFMVQRMKLDSKGNLYVCYINNEGPWNCAMGTIYRYNTDGTTDKIGPSNDSFGDIVIDPNDDNRLVAVTSGMWERQANGSYGDKFYTSTDGGKTWKNVLDSMEMDVNGMPWIEGCAIHWCSSLAINPFNANQIMVNSGNGVFSCDNIWDETPKFYFDSLGIEETVPEDIITMEGYPLISAVGDYDGFVHEDIFTPATRHQDMIGSTTSITIAAQNRDCWAKVGGDEKTMALTYTTDGGKTWTKITNSPEEGKVFYKGKIALNADGSVLVWSPSNGTKAYWTDNWGETWNVVDGIVGSNIYLIGDPSNSSYVYGCGSSVFYTSTDGGKTFARNSAISPSFRRLCVDPHNEGTVYIANGAGLMVTKDYGKTAEFVPGIKYCEAVGLGKAKNDGDPLVIYVWGTPMDGDNPGLYMSEDNGGTWTRINDDLHQFGGTGNGVFVSGDMNVYGRCYMSTVGLGIIYCDKNEK